MSSKFTPEKFISAPRRSPAVPNEDGTLALYTVSTYSLQSHSQAEEVRVLDIKTQQSILFTDDPKVTQVIWLQGMKVLWLKGIEAGKTEFWTGYAFGEREACLAGVVDAPVGSAKISAIDKAFALVVVGLSSHDGSLYNPETAPKPHSSVREYTTSAVRFWDRYWAKERNSLWYTTLEETEGGGFKLASHGLVNLLRGTLMECPFPDPLGDPAGQFDVSKSGITFTCRDIDTVLAKVLKTSLYYIPVSDFKRSVTIHKVQVAGFSGSAGSPVFNPSGTMIAFTISKDMYKPGNNHLYVIDTNDRKGKALMDCQEAENTWDFSPEALLWSGDSTSIYVTASDRGISRLFRVVLPTQSFDSKAPLAISSDSASVSAVYRLTSASCNHRLLVTKSSFVDSSICEIMDDSTGKSEYVLSATNHGSLFGLDASQISEIEFPGAGEYNVQAFVVRPSYFKPDKTYPFALLIHGGPQADWKNSWSTRWNPAVIAEQGYVVVLPNITGSTGWGEAYCNAVLGDWGGRPYNDLVKCFEYVETSLPYVDTSRAVALGGSYGGYMVNWIAGQPLAKKFKAMVCHDGIFALYNMLAGDITSGLDFDVGANLWDDKSKWDRFDPAQYTAHWSTPMLFIHSDKDFRCPTTEGWAAYAVCQGKGIESRFLGFPDENHWVLKPENSLAWHKTVLGWINKFAGVEGGVELRPPVTEPWVGVWD